MTNSIVPAPDCNSMIEVRDAIDELDRRIVALLAERMSYIEAAARIKPVRGDIRDEPRKAEVIEKACKAADEIGLSRDYVAAIYELLVERSIAHELDLFDASNAR